MHHRFSGQSDLLSHLRVATQSVHEEMEEQSVLTQCVQGHANREVYGRVLQALYPLFITVSHSKELISWLRRYIPSSGLPQAAERLHRELDILGIKPAAQKALPAWAAWEDESACVGTLYVLEGASLGGTAIAKALRAHYQLDLQPGDCFFDPYGRDCAAHWKRFHKAVQQREDTLCYVRATQAASATFSQYGACLDYAK